MEPTGKKGFLYNTKDVSKLAMAGIGLMVLLKVVGSIITGSIGIRADAIHSSIDFVGAFLGFLAIRLAGRPPDEDHPYGHHKAENIAGLFIAGLIFFAAGSIIYEAIRRLIQGGAVEMLSVGIWITAAAIIINVTISWWALRIARVNDSVALEATGKDLYADVLSSVAVLAGLLLVQFTGIAMLDPIIAILVGLLIGRTAYKTMMRSLGELMDKRLPEEEEKIIRDCINEHFDRVVDAHEFRTHKAGGQRFVDLHMVMPRDLNLGQAHHICDHIEHHIHHRLKRVSITIHLEPCRDECPSCVVKCDLKK
ncbi:MAG: cation transporter [Dehalococcoidia bacterium]|jgi:cation diffusion facilitator family transporter|nr:MAG: cation transporter [Dehalococcoidia bacterium]